MTTVLADEILHFNDFTTGRISEVLGTGSAKEDEKRKHRWERPTEFGIRVNEWISINRHIIRILSIESIPNRYLQIECPDGIMMRVWYFKKVTPPTSTLPTAALSVV